MQYSINFTDDQGVTKNTRTDWGLIPASRPSVGRQEIWSNPVSIPGINGQADLVRPYPFPTVNSYYEFREALVNDNPTYSQQTNELSLLQNGSGSFSFIIADQTRPWIAIYEEILNFMHNRHMRFQLDLAPEDDRSEMSSKTYYGRTSVSFSNGNDYSKIQIDYQLDQN